MPNYCSHFSADFPANSIAELPTNHSTLQTADWDPLIESIDPSDKSAEHSTHWKAVSAAYFSAHSPALSTAISPTIDPTNSTAD
jgi:hypothetical protein